MSGRVALRVQFLLVSQHLNKLLYAGGAGFRFLSCLNPEQDGIAVDAIQCVEEIPGLPIFVQRTLKISGDRYLTLRFVSRFLTTISLC